MLSLVAPASARVGQHVVIAINVESTSVAMKAITVGLRYDRARVRLVSMIAGDVMMQGGADSDFGYEEPRDSGEVRAVLSAIDSSGVTGTGSAATAEFEAIAEGPAAVSVQEFQVSDAAGHRRGGGGGRFIRECPDRSVRRLGAAVGERLGLESLFSLPLDGRARRRASRPRAAEHAPRSVRWSPSGSASMAVAPRLRWRAC